MADISAIELPSGDTYALKDKVAREGIAFGTVDSTSTSKAYTATVDGVESLRDGTCVMLKNGKVTSESGFTLNVNGLGAKPVYTNLAAATRDTTIFNVNYTMLFVYDTARVSGGAWICYRGYDSNTNTIGYQVRTNSSTRPAYEKGYRYRLWFSSADGQKWVPANTSTATDATTARTANDTPIDPFGPIVYNSTNGTVNAAANLATSTCWQQYTLSLGYSFTDSLSLTTNDPVYVKCLPQSDGSAVMKGTTQALPTTADGYIYIFLGIAYSTTAIELYIEHPVYWHDGTGIRVWTGDEPTQVSVSQTLSSGTEVGSVTVDGTSTTLYAPTPPTKTSDLTNDSGFITDAGVTSFNGSTGAVTYSPPVDSALSTSSSNPVANSVVAGVAAVATSAASTAGSALSMAQGALIYDHTYSISNGVATFTPHVYQGGTEVTTNYAASCFTWFYRLINGSEVALTTKSDRGCDVTISSMGYGGSVVGTFTPA